MLRELFQFQLDLCLAYIDQGNLIILKDENIYKWGFQWWKIADKFNGESNEIFIIFWWVYLPSSFSFFDLML